MGRKTDCFEGKKFFGNERVEGRRVCVKPVQPLRLVLAAFFVFWIGSPLSAQAIAWLEDVDAALAEAKRTDKIVMVDIFTEWCGWCKKLDKEVYADSKVVALSKGFVNLKINPELGGRGAEFSGSFRVDGFPTILFVEPDGSLVYRIPGYVNAAAFAGKMEKVAGSRAKIKSARGEFETGDYRNSFEFITLLADLGLGGEAASVFDKVVEAAALDDSQREVSALAVARCLLDEEDFTRVLGYAVMAEKLDSGSGHVHAARYYRAVALFYVSGKAEAVAFLDSCLGIEKTPDLWKKRYAALKENMNKAE